jgi:hypothetical protein
MLCALKRDMKSINRQVAVIKPKEPYVAWINSLPDMIDDPSSIESLNNDCTALLLPHFDDDEESIKFIKQIHNKIFEIELESWSTDKKTWPKNKNYILFCDWFKVEFHSEVFDFGEGAVEIDEY